MLLAAPVSPVNPPLPHYELSIRCSVLNTVFSGSEEDETSQAAKDYQTSGTAWLVHATLVGEAQGRDADSDYNAALDALLAKLDDPASKEGFLDDIAIQCAKMEVEHADMFAKYLAK